MQAFEFIWCYWNLFGVRNSYTLIFYQQQQAVSSPNAHQQADPEYEVIELSENMAYEPVQRIEMKANEAYQFVGQCCLHPIWT